MPGESFENRMCTAPAERTDRLVDIVAGAATAPANTALDLGCGTGRLARVLASRGVVHSIVGIDVSGPNVAAARAGSDAGGAVRFERADYRSYAGGPFDLIVTDGVLHLIPGDTETLVAKLARDLRDGGVLVCCMPFDGWYNRVFARLRAALRVVRCRWLDALFLVAGRWRHGSTMSDEALRERIPYMYIPPERLMGPAFRRIAAASGLRVVAAHAMPSQSGAQLRHNVTIFQKDTRTA